MILSKIMPGNALFSIESNWPFKIDFVSSSVKTDISIDITSANIHNNDEDSLAKRAIIDEREHTRIRVVSPESKRAQTSHYINAHSLLTLQIN